MTHDDPSLAEHAQRLAKQLALPTDDTQAELAIHLDQAGLSLCVQQAPEHDPTLAQGKPFVLNLEQLDTTSSFGGMLKQPALKAIGIKKGNPERPAVVDATAGLGEDSYLFHQFGCEVIALEQHPVIHAILQDGFKRAGCEIQAYCADALDWLQETTDRPDVVYLDPMFPSERKATPRKPMRLLAWLLADTPSTDEAALLKVAQQTATQRVVVKRPRLAPPLAGIEPMVTHKGRSVRYDVYRSQAEPN